MARWREGDFVCCVPVGMNVWVYGTLRERLVVDEVLIQGKWVVEIADGQSWPAEWATRVFGDEREMESRLVWDILKRYGGSTAQAAGLLTDV